MAGLKLQMVGQHKNLGRFSDNPMFVAWHAAMQVEAGRRALKLATINEGGCHEVGPRRIRVISGAGVVPSGPARSFHPGDVS